MSNGICARCLKVGDKSKCPLPGCQYRRFDNEYALDLLTRETTNEFITEDMLTCLDEIREQDGIANLIDAGVVISHLVDQFSISAEQAESLLDYWWATYTQRQKDRVIAWLDALDLLTRETTPDPLEEMAAGGKRMIATGNKYGFTAVDESRLPEYRTMQGMNNESQLA
jgi:hypothetical protein